MALVFCLFFNTNALALADDLLSEDQATQLASPEVSSPETVLDPNAAASDATPVDATPEVGPTIIDSPKIDMTPSAQAAPSLSEDTSAPSLSSAGADDLVVKDSYIISSKIPPTNRFNGLQSDHVVDDALVDEFTGELKYGYPLDLPAGRGAAQPSLELLYRNTNQDIYSLVGLGWELAIPHIYRYSRRGVDGLYVDQSFMSTLPGLDGELAAENTDELEYGAYLQTVRTNASTFVFSNDETWVITDSRGVRYFFGESPSAREASDDDTKIFAWYLTSIVDTNGNTVTYSYKKSQGNVYPTRIIYGEASQPIEIRFQPYFDEAIPEFDILPSYARLFPVVEKKQVLSSIEIIDPLSSRRLNYRFGYVAEFTYSLLSTITKSGTATDGAVVSLPPTKFTYDSYRGENSRPLTLPAGVKMDIYNYGYPPAPYWIYADYDGDGWEDLVVSALSIGRKVDTYTQKFRLRNGLTWGEENIIPYKYPFFPMWYIDRYGYKESYPIFNVDLNGDFRPAFCINGQQYDTGCSDGPWLHYGDTGYYGIIARLFDLNADQLPDAFMFSGTNHAGNELEIQKNDGRVMNNVSAFDFSTGMGPWELNPYSSDSSLRVCDVSDYPPYSFNWESLLNHGAIIIDMNRDGLDDFVHYQHAVKTYRYNTRICDLTTKKVLLNKGDNTWEDVTDMVNLPTFFENSTYDTQDQSATITQDATLLDVNSDGLPDVLERHWYNNRNYTPARLNDGKKWEEGLERWSPIDWRGQDERTTRNDPRYLDLNKDTVFGNDFSDGYNNLVGLPLLKNIELPLGGSIKVEYTPASSYLNPDGTPANHELPIAYLTVSKVAVSAGVGGVSGATTYSYSGGKLYRPHEVLGVQKQEFQGFGKVEKTLADGTVVTSFFDQGSPESLFAGKKFLQKQITSSSTGIKLEETTSKLAIAELVPGKSFEARQKSTISSILAPDGSSKSRAVGFDYDIYGNVITQTNYGEVRQDTDSEENFVDVGVDKLVTMTTFALNLEKNIVALASGTETYDQDSQLVGKTEWLYDELPWGSVTKGNQTSEKTWVDATKTRETLTRFTSEGLPSEALDPLGNATEYTYEGLRLRPSKITNTKGQTTEIVYDTLTGVPIQTLDQNNLRTEAKLDGVGRPTEIWISDPDDPSELVKKEELVYELNPSSYQKITHRSYRSAEAEPILTYQLLDGLQRETQSGLKTSENKFIVTVQRYDQRGLLAQKSLPFEVDNSDSVPWSKIDSQLITTLTYDALGRVVAENNALGQTMITYDLWTKQIIDSNGHRRDLVLDAFGQLIQVREYSGDHIYATSYDYSPTGNLIRQTNALGYTRAMTYDWLGQELTAELWHSPLLADPSKISHTYDLAGNVLSQTDALDTTIENTYDSLNRLLTQREAEAPQALWTLVYDSGEYGMGRLSSVTGQNMQTDYTYDLLGRTIAETRKINTNTFVTGFHLDWFGNTAAVIYPDQSIAKYDYDLAGRIIRVLLDDQVIADNIQYAPPGTIAALTFGNGVQTSDTFDPRQLYRLAARLTINAEGLKLQDLQYTYDSMDNLTRLLEARAGDPHTADYVYDELDRLIGAEIVDTETGVKESLQYSYDATGNLLHSTESGDYEYSAAQPQAATRVGERTFSYDRNGNLIQSTP